MKKIHCHCLSYLMMANIKILSFYYTIPGNENLDDTGSTICERQKYTKGQINLFYLLLIRILKIYQRGNKSHPHTSKDKTESPYAGI